MSPTLLLVTGVVILIFAQIGVVAILLRGQAGLRNEIARKFAEERAHTAELMDAQQVAAAILKEQEAAKLRNSGLPKRWHVLIVAPNIGNGITLPARDITTVTATAVPALTAGVPGQTDEINGINRICDMAGIPVRTITGPVTLSLMNDAISESHPNILQFVGHSDANYILTGDGPVSMDVLAQIMADRGIELVILNSCYSIRGGKQIASAGMTAIATRAHTVSGLTQGLNGEIAVAFSEGFYKALVGGMDIWSAWAQGCRAARIARPNAEWGDSYTIEPSTRPASVAVRS